MEWFAPIAGILSQIAFFGLIIWIVVRVLGSGEPRGSPGHQVVSVRRLFVYGLLFATLILAAVGTTFVVQELTGSTSDDRDEGRSTLALGLAFVIVAGPAFVLLLRQVLGRLRESASERRSIAWAAYLNLSLSIPLIVTIVTSQQLLEEAAGVDDFGVESLAPVMVWGGVWATHWFWLKARFGLPGDFHLAIGSLAGLATLAIGAGGLAFVAGDEIYRRLVDAVPASHVDPEPRIWAIASVIGAGVWAWHWLGHYLRAERTELWHVYVVLLGALGGLVGAVVSAATIGYRTAVWYIGDPHATIAAEHFEFAPVAAAVLVVGAAAWWYHRLVLHRREGSRTEALRAYDYLMAGAGLVATVVAATLVLVSLLELVTPEPEGVESSIANQLILAGVLAVIGAPLWRVVWSRIQRLRNTDPAAELRSTVRRIHSIVVFGVGGIVVLVSLIAVLFIGIEDLLDGRFGSETLRSCRVPLALVVTTTGVTWYHLGVFRSDRDELAEIRPTPRSFPVSSPVHLLVVAPRGASVGTDLAFATGADVDSWYRTDETAVPSVDVDELAAEIRATDARKLIVLVDRDGTRVVPVEP